VRISRCLIRIKDDDQGWDVARMAKISGMSAQGSAGARMPHFSNYLEYKVKNLILSLVALLAVVPFTFGQGQDGDEIKRALGADNAREHTIADHLQDISVTIVSKDSFGFGGEGSGFIKTRKMPNGDVVNFVWTAAHVVSNLRHERTVIDSKTGTRKTVVEFSDAIIVKGLKEDGRNVGKIEMFAEVVRFSSEEDLALLRIRKKNFVKGSVKFYLKDKIPALGAPSSRCQDMASLFQTS